MIKRFLVPVLALAAFGSPMGAATITYCQTYCGANDIAAFNAATGGLGSTTLSTFSNGNISTNGDGLSQYLDSTTGLLFVEQTFDPFEVASGALEVSASFDSINITVPASVTGVVLSLSAGGSGQQYAIDGTNVNLSTTPVMVGIANSAGSIGIISITHEAGGPLEVDGFNAQGASQASTPEIGTLLLIGAGLIAMRWLKRVPRRVFRTLQPA